MGARHLNNGQAKTLPHGQEKKIIQRGSIVCIQALNLTATQATIYQR